MTSLKNGQFFRSPTPPLWSTSVQIKVNPLNCGYWSSKFQGTWGFKQCVNWTFTKWNTHHSLPHFPLPQPHIYTHTQTHFFKIFSNILDLVANLSYSLKKALNLNKFISNKNCLLRSNAARLCLTISSINYSKQYSKVVPKINLSIAKLSREHWTFLWRIRNHETDNNRTFFFHVTTR